MGLAIGMLSQLCTSRCVVIYSVQNLFGPADGFILRVSALQIVSLSLVNLSFIKNFYYIYIDNACRPI